MKIRVTLYDCETEEVTNYDGTLEFVDVGGNSDLALDTLDAIARVVTAFETQHGVCIDHGGDDEFYELDIADYDPTMPCTANIKALCEGLVADIEKALPNQR